MSRQGPNAQCENFGKFLPQWKKASGKKRERKKAREEESERGRKRERKKAREEESESRRKQEELLIVLRS
jgi:hypothetical protein